MTTSLPPALVQLAVLPDPSGLLAAIMANPAEDDPRLRYADYLDENAVVARVKCQHPLCDKGKVYSSFQAKKIRCRECKGLGTTLANPLADRAEYIRLFIACFRDLIDPARPLNVSRDRSDRLMALWVKCFEAGGSWRGGFKYHMDRGFIADLRCDWRTWVAFGDAIRAEEWVPLVKIDGDYPTFESVAINNEGTKIALAGQLVTLPGLVEVDWRSMTAILEARWPGTKFESGVEQ